MTAIIITTAAALVVVAIAGLLWIESRESRRLARMDELIEDHETRMDEGYARLREKRRQIRGGL